MHFYPLPTAQVYNTDEAYYLHALRSELACCVVENDFILFDRSSLLVQPIVRSFVEQLSCTGMYGR